MISNQPVKEGARIRDHSTSENAALSLGGDAYSATIALQSKDLRLFRQREAAREAAAAAKDVEPDEPSFVRPQTPPQGSNHSPWTSYHNLPRSHPVFEYPDDVRAKLYKKGIDPVLKAQNDKFRFGSAYHDGKSMKEIGGRFKRAFGRVGNSTLASLS